MIINKGLFCLCIDGHTLYYDLIYCFKSIYFVLFLSLFVCFVLNLSKYNPI